MSRTGLSTSTYDANGTTRPHRHQPRTLTYNVRDQTMDDAAFPSTLLIGAVVLTIAGLAQGMLVIAAVGLPALAVALILIRESVPMAAVRPHGSRVRRRGWR